ncbi:MAG: cytochrome c [Armatimonadetes bacterium]|nr:cytochrome c [Armatimonadota bacterium]
MVRRVAWVAITLFPLIVLGTIWKLRRDPTRPNVILPTNMAISPAYKAQSENVVFANGATMQDPVPGTLSRAAHPFHYAKTPEDCKRAGVKLRNPFPHSPEVLKEGQRLSETFCLPCHGATGNGDGPIIPRFPNPPSFHTAQSKSLKDGEIFHIVTLGRGKMASYASQLSWEERWKVIHYLRELQKQ